MKADLTPAQAARRIAGFERRFEKTPGHMVLALQGAFPLTLTADLLYRLAAYFQTTCDGRPLPIPWIAVADILLSPLVREVGDEVYEMYPAVRQTLLARLEADERFGPRRVEALAQFLLAYARASLESADPETRSVARTQALSAQAQLEPDAAVEALAEAFRETEMERTAAVLRLSRLTGLLGTAEPMQRAADFATLSQYAQGVENLARGQEQAGTSAIAQAARGKREVTVGKVTLPIPARARQGLNFPEFFLIHPLAGEFRFQARFDRPTTIRLEPVERYEGLILAVSPGEAEALAPQRGLVDEVGNDPDGRYGRLVRLRHDWPNEAGRGYSTWTCWLGGLEEIYVQPGQFVLAGQPVGRLEPDSRIKGSLRATLALIVQNKERGRSGFRLPDVVDPEPLLRRPGEAPRVDEAQLRWPDGPAGEPRQALASESFSVTLEVRNIGNTTWEGGYALHEAGRDRLGSEEAMPLPALKPGEEVTVSATLQAPPEPGRYRSIWIPRSGNGFLFPSGVAVEIAAVHDFMVVEETHTNFLAESTDGRRYVTTWRLRNGGRSTWDRSYRLEPVADGTIRPETLELVAGDEEQLAEDIETAAPTPLVRVAPGDALEMTVNFTTADEPGVYRGLWRMVNADGQPFGDVLAAEATGSDEPSAQRQAPAGPETPLYQLMAESFRLTEIEELGVEARVDYVDLPGHSRSLKALNLYQFMLNHGLVTELLGHLRRLRPTVDLSPYLYLAVVEQFPDEKELVALLERFNLEPRDPGRPERLVWGSRPWLEEKGRLLVQRVSGQARMGELMATLAGRGVDLGFLPDGFDESFPAPPARDRPLPFDMEVRRLDEAGRYQRAVTRSPAGEGYATGPLPMPLPELQTMVSELAESTRAAEVSAALGEMVGQWLLTNELSGILTSSLRSGRLSNNEPDAAGAAIHFRLRVEPSELHSIPWEYASLPGLGALARLPGLSISRQQPRPYAADERQGERPLRVLIASASPTEYRAADLGEEAGRLATALSRLAENGLVEVQREDHISYRRLLEAVSTIRPHALHLFADVQPEPDGRPVLLLEGEGGRVERFWVNDLAVRFGDYGLALVLRGGRDRDATAQYAAVANSLVQNAPNVVTLVHPLPAASAIYFSRRLYRYLASGWPIYAAVGEARRDLAARDPVYWGIPVLFTSEAGDSARRAA